MIFQDPFRSDAIETLLDLEGLPIEGQYIMQRQQRSGLLGLLTLNLLDQLNGTLLGLLRREIIP